MFVGREEELAGIKRTPETSRFEATLIYGLRRTGKLNSSEKLLKNVVKRLFNTNVNIQMRQ